MLAKEQASLVVSDINADNAKKTIEQLPANNASHLSVAVNVAERQSVENMFKETMAKFNKPPTIVVNCAGITRDAQMGDMTDEQWDQVINVNLKGTWLTSQIACKLMKEHKVPEGSIVNIASIVGKTGNFGQTNYSATKAGVVGLSKTIAKEMAKHNIRCNVVMPGFIDTPMVASVPDNVMTIMKMMIPQGRQGKPEEVAEAIMWLASSKSSYVTGATIEVTGGLFM